MYSQKYKLTDDILELQLRLFSDIPADGAIEPWTVYIQRVGKDSESVLHYTMRTLAGVIVSDKLLIHIELLKTEELAQLHLTRNHSRIVKELERIGHVTRVHRIEAVRHFGNQKDHTFIAPGDKGGYVQRLTNLSHDGDCWVGGDAIVCDAATVCDDAGIWGNAVITDGAVYERAVVGANAHMTGGSVYGRAYVAGFTQITVGDKICGDTIYAGPNIRDPIIIFKAPKRVKKSGRDTQNHYCQFPFNNGKPRLPRRNPGGDLGGQIDLE